MPSDLLKIDPTQAGLELPATEDARIQPIHPRHAADLAAAYLAAYPPEVAATTLHDATREMEQTFANHYGRLLPECSSAAVLGARAVGPSLWSSDPSGIPDFPVPLSSTSSWPPLSGDGGWAAPWCWGHWRAALAGGTAR